VRGEGGDLLAYSEAAALFIAVPIHVIGRYFSFS
jgi:hypothetical protein